MDFFARTSSLSLWEVKGHFAKINFRKIFFAREFIILYFLTVEGIRLTDFAQIENSIIEVKKRDGRVLNFQKDKIAPITNF